MLPIDLDILQKRQEIPIKLAELSYADQENALRLLRVWGEKKSPISVLHKEIVDCLKEVN
ncbi:hypothetical protein NSA56_11445 [Oceanobacillus caeni]|uniref:hypothetical protein n=1 Tax=Oceanobacillus caeni TaxID=405946 RepID=UPI002149DF4C|nr:hypothetical protein [Oceanobacillus caeni]MCR1835010.1 hypothetical protein [Oceanobacillus caeni]